MNDKKIKWTEQTPENIEYLKKKAGDKSNYNHRIYAINQLKKFKWGEPQNSEKIVR